MSREIKFRLWDGKKMYYDGFFLDSDGTPYWNDTQNVADGIVLQSTGLKDKNGKEIYEGDIVSFPKQPKYKRVWQVEWHNGGLRLVDGVAYRMLNSDHHGEVGEEGEIIGNIYENPELLK